MNPKELQELEEICRILKPLLEARAATNRILKADAEYMAATEAAEREEAEANEKFEEEVSHHNELDRWRQS